MNFSKSVLYLKILLYMIWLFFSMRMHLFMKQLGLVQSNPDVKSNPLGNS